MVLIPAAFLLSQLGRLPLVWIAFPVAEVMSIVLALIFVRRTIHRLDWEKKPEQEAQTPSASSNA